MTATASYSRPSDFVASRCPGAGEGMARRLLSAAISSIGPTWIARLVGVLVFILRRTFLSLELVRVPRLISLVGAIMFAVAFSSLAPGTRAAEDPLVEAKALYQQAAELFHQGRFAGGDWIRTSSTWAREVGCRAPTAAKLNGSTKPAVDAHR